MSFKQFRWATRYPIPTGKIIQAAWIVQSVVHEFVWWEISRFLTNLRCLQGQKVIWFQHADKRNLNTQIVVVNLTHLMTSICTSQFHV